MQKPYKIQRDIKVAVTYRVCQRWRAPIFARLAKTEGISLKIFHGESIPGTKLVNAENFDGIPHSQLRTYVLQVRSTGRTVPALLYPGIIRELSRFRPDVILCEGGSNIFNNLLIYPWAYHNGIATMWWSLGGIPGRKFRGISRIYRAITRAMMLRSTVLLGYSSGARDSFLESGYRQPIFVAVNCIDTDRAFRQIDQAKANPENIRRKFNLGQKKVLLFVGALTAPKRIENLLQAYARIRTSRDDVGLMIVGDGTERARLEDLSNSLNLADVHFAGHVVDQVSHYFLSADLFVLPGLGGLAISEAMCYGLPVVCAVADGCEADLVCQNKNGFVIPTGDIEHMSQAILKILDNPKKMKEMGQNSLDIILERYNIHSYLDNIIAAIRCAYKRGRACKLTI